MDVTIVIVSFNVAELLYACLNSIKKETGLNYEIIVVDNDSSDHSIEMMRKIHPDVKLIENQSNVGFAKANNQAFLQARGRYIFMLNPDTIVLENAIDKLVRFMDAHPEAGACGPRVIYPDGSLQFTCHHFPTNVMRLVEHFQLHKKHPKNRFFGKEFMSYFDYAETKEVDWITGCALLLRNDALDAIGLLDEKYFMYSEEADLCYRLHKNGWKIAFYPEAEIVHYQGISSLNLKDEKVLSKSVVKYLFSSKYYFFRKNYNIFSAYLLRIIDFTFYSAYFLKSIFVRNTAERKSKLSHITFVLSVIISGEYN